MRNFVLMLFACGAIFAQNPVIREDSAGKVPAAKLPAPAAGSLGGVQSKTCSAGYHVSTIGTDGTITCTADQGGSSFAMTAAGQGLWNLLTGSPGNFTSSTAAVPTADWANGSWSITQIVIPFSIKLNKLLMDSGGSGASGDVFVLALFNDNGAGAPAAKIPNSDVVLVGNTTAAWARGTWSTQPTLSAGVYWLGYSSSSSTGKWLIDASLSGSFGSLQAKNNASTPRYYKCSNTVTYTGSSTTLPSSCTTAAGSASQNAPLVVVEQ